MAIQTTVLVASPDSQTRRALRRLLAAQGHVVLSVPDLRDVPLTIQVDRPDLIILDAAADGTDALSVCRHLREAEATRDLPVILLTAATTLEEIWRQSAAHAVLRTPPSDEALSSWTRCLIRAGQVRENLERVESALVDLAVALEARSLYPEGHQRRVAATAAQLAAAADLDATAADVVRRAALLHDVGIIVLPDGLLRKPGPLTPDEFKAMTQHTLLGAEMCRHLANGTELSAIIRGHHERWNGTGYPDGLLEEAIPLGARILAVADAFDALTTPRPYRTAFDISDALEILFFGAGEQWDARIVSLLDTVVRPGLATPAGAAGSPKAKSRTRVKTAAGRSLAASAVPEF